MNRNLGNISLPRQCAVLAWRYVDPSLACAATALPSTTEIDGGRTTDCVNPAEEVSQNWMHCIPTCANAQRLILACVKTGEHMFVKLRVIKVTRFSRNADSGKRAR